MKILFPWLILLPFSASACPFCHTATGMAIWSGIFNKHFFWTFSAVISPFIVFGLISYLIYYGFYFPFKHTTHRTISREEKK